MRRNCTGFCRKGEAAGVHPEINHLDRQTKVPHCRRLPGVREILLIVSCSVFAEVLRRDGARWLTEIVRGAEAMLTLASIGLNVRTEELYEGLDLAATGAADD